MTPAPNLLGKPALTIAGSRIEPIATTVAGLEPETAANSAQAMTPARPRPPYQWPTMSVANLIIRLATPPCVRKLPARMKNGMAMISNFSMPVNSLSATDSSGTWVIVNRKVRTVRPSEIEIGMPVSMRMASRVKITRAFMAVLLRHPDCGVLPGAARGYASRCPSGDGSPLRRSPTIGCLRSCMCRLSPML
jgi:hypothetical protein